MPRFKSNGPYASKNERKLEGQIVVVRQHKDRIMAIGRLTMIRANTRGNWTLGVKWKQQRPADGRMVGRDLPIWTLRQQPFTIESFIADNPRIDELAWMIDRGVKFPEVTA